jgi:hypothetical protein
VLAGDSILDGVLASFWILREIAVRCGLIGEAIVAIDVGSQDRAVSSNY